MREIRFSDRSAVVLGSEASDSILVQPVDSVELSNIEQEYSIAAQLTDRPFQLAALPVKSWNGELSPWYAEPVFGKEPFSGGAEGLLRFMENELIPRLESECACDAPRFFIGGYSLAGLFALWSGYRSPAFDGAACVSPSVWFPGWREFIEQSKPLCKRFYLSLGDAEEKARSRVLARVGDNIRFQFNALDSSGSVDCVLEWNQGNHFSEPAKRTAKGFAWLINRSKER